MKVLGKDAAENVGEGQHRHQRGCSLGPEKDTFAHNELCSPEKECIPLMGPFMLLLSICETLGELPYLSEPQLLHL